MSDQYYKELIATHGPYEAACAARARDDETLVAELLAEHRADFLPDEEVHPQRADGQRRYIIRALKRKVPVEAIIICAQAIGEGSFTEKVLKQKAKE